MESLRKLAKRFAIILFALPFCLPATSEADTFYRVTILGSDVTPSSINNAGQVVGRTNESYGHPFLWSAKSGTKHFLQKATAVDINDLGQVIMLNEDSNSGFNDFGFLWSTGSGMQSLGNKYPFKINNLGQIVGITSLSDNNYRDAHVSIWNGTGSSWQDLTDKFSLGNYFNDFAYNFITPVNQGYYASINDNGQVVVQSNGTYALVDTISLTKTPIPLSGFASSYVPIAINNLGQIAGVDLIYKTNSGTFAKAFIWSANTGIKYLPLMEGSFNNTYVPISLNNLGQIVGLNDITPFIWNDSDGSKNLNYLIDPDDPLIGKIAITIAHDINDHGQIVATARTRDINDSSIPFKSQVAILLTPLSSLTIDLLDPVPALLVGSTVSTNPESLAKKGRIVEGVGTDGVATLVLRIHASSVGESITLTLDGAFTDEAGALGMLGTTPDALTTTVTAESTTEGPMAFALYRAPVDFAWNESHHSLQRRSVTLNASSTSGGSTTKSIQVIRPPVVLVHGLWGSPSDWADFDLYKNPAFTRFTIDYEGTNSEAFTLNARNLAIDISQSLEAFAKRKKIAIAQADFVAHSMGGDITRSMPSNINYSKRNFNKGYVHKLITIGTPHLGSPLARELIKPENACLIPNLSEKGLVVKADGAVGDLKGDGDGNGLSDALKKLQNMPMAMLAGRISENQIHGLPTADVPGFDGAIIKFHYVQWYLTRGCTVPPFPPLIEKFKPENYSTLMGGYHDGIVPLTSATNSQWGEVWGDGLKEEGGLHSNGTMDLGFSGPYLLEGDSLISRRVVDLLNTPVTETEFIKP